MLYNIDIIFSYLRTNFHYVVIKFFGTTKFFITVLACEMPII